LRLRERQLPLQADRWYALCLRARGDWLEVLVDGSTLLRTRAGRGTVHPPSPTLTRVVPVPTIDGAYRIHLPAVARPVEPQPAAPAGLLGSVDDQEDQRQREGTRDLACRVCTAVRSRGSAGASPAAASQRHARTALERPPGDTAEPPSGGKSRGSGLIARVPSPHHCLEPSATWEAGVAGLRVATSQSWRGCWTRREHGFGGPCTAAYTCSPCSLGVQSQSIREATVARQGV
jgi:hypothetical protein